MSYNLFDIAAEMFIGLKNFGGATPKFAVYESNIPTTDGDSVVKQPEPTNVSTIYTAARILSGAISSMPVSVRKDNEEFKDNRHYYPLRYRVSDRYNNQTFWSTIEYHRAVYGNAFVDIRNASYEIIHPALVDDYRYIGGKLELHVAWDNADKILGKQKYSRKSEWIPSESLLHFKAVSVDGVFGLTPINAVAHGMKIMDKASNTIINFYNNKAMGSMALESTVTTAGAAKATKESSKDFKGNYTGTWNAGKIIPLPANTKLTPLAQHFADAELIDTMKFTEKEIYTMYGIPPFMYTDTAAGDIEQQTLQFKTFTIAPTVKMYEEELDYKLLTKKERLNGVEVKFNTDYLIESDLSTKANAYGTMVMRGMMTPNEAAAKVGSNPIEGPFGDMHLVQTQMIPLELYQYNPLMNEGKEVNDNTNDNNTDNNNESN